MLLEGKAALVTGAARGIGRAIAQRFAREGADVIVNYLHNQEQALNAVSDIHKLGRRAYDVQADVGNPKDVDRLVQVALERFGKIDVLVNNAGFGLPKTFDTTEAAEWDRIIAVHLKGVFLTTQLAGRHMRKRKTGSVINISSIAGKVALPDRVMYSTVEAAKNMFTQALACEWAQEGVRLNCIAPGVMLTDHVRQKIANGILDSSAVLKRIPLGRFGETGEVASVAAFLGSEDSSYITGQVLYVDGGWTTWAGWPGRERSAENLTAPRGSQVGSDTTAYPWDL